VKRLLLDLNVFLDVILDRAPDADAVAALWVAIDAAIVRGTRNVLADLGYPNAAERQAKLRLAYALNQVLRQRKLSQAEAAKVLGVTQPKVSALRHYKLAGFSVERLMNLLTALDQDIEIVIRRKPRSRRAGRISIVAP
jgi:predicted XRE-type DNA-binding protein